MNSAPAVLRAPAVVAEATPVSTPEMFESYPWAVQTPETSPRCWDKLPCFEAQVPVKPMVSRDSLQSACMPSFEQMFHSVESNIFAYQLTAEGALSHELLRKMCEPFFEQMTTAMQQTVQQTLQQNAQQPTQRSLATCQPCQPTIDSGTYFQAPTLYRFDEESTEAEDSCAFVSLLSGASSDVDPLDAIDRKSEGSDAAGDADKNIMVCRHWKSKGWCRLESNCKFLHPEHKRGISKTEGEGAVAASTSSVRRKKRGGKNRSTKAQLGSEGQNVVGALS